VPRTSLTRPIGRSRRLAVLSVPLEPVHAVAHAHKASINDAVLAAVAGGLRAVLASRGEPADVTLRASVPVSLRAAEHGAAGGLGNRVGVLIVPLPLRERDALRRMELIADATRQEKVRARQAGPLAVMTTTLGIRLALPLLRRQRLVSVFVTNVPGPTTPLHLAGARLLRAYPAGPIAGNVTLGVGVLSYAGGLGLGLTADAEAWPDLPVFVDALRESFDALTGATRQ
jgi:WS/DGAT/MGAT family acyltransferase